MTNSPKPLTPEEIAALIRQLGRCLEEARMAGTTWHEVPVSMLTRLLSAAERLAECERQLAEAHAVIVGSRMLMKEHERIRNEARLRHAAGAKEPEHE